MISFNQAILLCKNSQDPKIIELQTFFTAQYGKALRLVDYDEDALPSVSPDTLCYLYLDDLSIKQFLKTHLDQEFMIAILPHKECSDAILRYGTSKDIKVALEESLNETLRVDDQILLCNGEVVFKKISIGNVHNLNKQVFSTSIIEDIKTFITHLKNLKYQAMTLTTAKENRSQTVASGVLVLEDYTIFHTLKSVESSSFHDGKLNAFIISPLSLFSYFYYQLAILLHHKFGVGSLPKNIGFISTKKLTLSGQKPFDFFLDDQALSAKEIEMEVVQTSLNISYGKSFQSALDEKNEHDDKESVNIRHLPKGELTELLIEGKVPLLKKASDEDLKETLSAVKESAQVSSIYITLMILSTLLATVGIFQDSTPTVIGAMILAPLMAPIISLSMGMARSDNKIIKKSTITLIFGIFSVLVFSALLTLFIPLDMTTTQMSSRVHPNLLDLFVAIFSGIAGAYALSKEEVAKSLAGVAIAVALVPPLSVTGIGIGWGDPAMIYGSFLLFLSNLFGMVSAASLTFVILGFAPIHRAKKGLIYSSVMLVLVSIPLMYAFYSLILQSNDYARLHQIKSFHLTDKSVHLSIVNIRSSTAKQAIVESEISAATPLTQRDYKEIQLRLEKALGKEVILEVIPKIIIK